MSAAMKNFAVLASGYGSNLQAIIEAEKKGKIRARLTLVISDRKDAFVLQRAKKAKIPLLFVDPAHFADRESYDCEIIKHLKTAGIDFVVLAGFMRILSPQFIQNFKNKILNVHPALLPAFKGSRAIEDAFHYGVKVTGVTIHLVDEKVDHGPIILQETVVIEQKDTLAKLKKKIHALEHRLYPKAIDLFARGKVSVVGRKVIIGSRV